MPRYFLLFIFGFTLTAYSAQDDAFAHLLSQLPQPVQADAALMRDLNADLAETFNLHPDLLYSHMQVLLSLYAPQADRERKEFAERQFKRQQAVYLKLRREWTLEQLRELEQRSGSEKRKAFVHKLYIEVRSQRLVNFPDPEEIGLDQQQELDFYTCLSLSDSPIIFSTETDYAEMKKSLYSEVSSDLLALHADRDPKEKATRNALWIYLDQWYLFDHSGNTEYLEPGFNVVDLLVSVLESEPVRSFQLGSVFRTVRVNSKNLYATMALPESEVAVSVDLKHPSSQLTLESGHRLKGPRLLGGGGLNIELSERRKVFSALECQLLFGLFEEKHPTTIQVDTTITHQYYPSFSVRENWDYNVTFGNLKSSILILSAQTPIIVWGSHFSVGIGGRYQWSASSFDLEYHIQSTEWRIYDNDFEVPVYVPDMEPVRETSNDLSSHGTLFASLHFHPNHMLRLSADVTNGPILLTISAIFP